MELKIFCERLRELRLEKGLSYIQLGKLLSVADNTVGRWERGLMIPSIVHLYKMAKLFSVTTDYLVGLEN